MLAKCLNYVFGKICSKNTFSKDLGPFVCNQVHSFVFLLSVFETKFNLLCRRLRKFLHGANVPKWFEKSCPLFKVTQIWATGITNWIKSSLGIKDKTHLNSTVLVKMNFNFGSFCFCVKKCQPLLHKLADISESTNLTKDVFVCWLVDQTGVIHVFCFKNLYVVFGCVKVRNVNLGFGESVQTGYEAKIWVNFIWVRIIWGHLGAL